MFDAAVAAADPYAATYAALVARLSERSDDGRAWIIATGKASARMAAAALDAARETDIDVAGGIVIGVAADDHAALESVAGDHPLPGAQSRHAAARIGAIAHAVIPSDHVLLTISGGSSSLIAAPADGVDGDALDRAFRTLLGAGGGVDIHVMNAIRRRFLRWGGGRLAAALAPAHVHQVLLSDVIGDDPSVIGSGPAVPDPTDADELLALMESNGLYTRLDDSLVAFVRDVASGAREETPKPGDALFASVDDPVVLGRTMLHDGMLRYAEENGVQLIVHDEPLTGEAQVRGTAIAQWLASEAGTGTHCWSGETTVALGNSHGDGGRCQELALAAALALESLGDAGRRVTLLAAGTDGRDGPTDAAGAVVDASTPKRIRDRGLDPAALLAAHDSYRALDAAGALLRTGPTGTNVADVVIATVV